MKYGIIRTYLGWIGLLISGMFFLYVVEVLILQLSIDPRFDNLGSIRDESGCAATAVADYIPVVYNKRSLLVYEINFVEVFPSQIRREYVYVQNDTLPQTILNAGNRVVVWDCGPSMPQDAIRDLIEARQAHSWAGRYITPWGIADENLSICMRFIHRAAEVSRMLARTFNEVWDSLQ